MVFLVLFSLSLSNICTELDTMQSHLKLRFMVCILVFRKYFSTCLLILTWAPSIYCRQFSIQPICDIYEVYIVYVYVWASIYTYVHILES